MIPTRTRNEVQTTELLIEVKDVPFVLIGCVGGPISSYIRMPTRLVLVIPALFGLPLSDAHITPYIVPLLTWAGTVIVTVTRATELEGMIRLEGLTTVQLVNSFGVVPPAGRNSPPTLVAADGYTFIRAAAFVELETSICCEKTSFAKSRATM